MGSMWKSIRMEAENKPDSAPTCISEIPEADLYYFVALDENNEMLSEGELPRFKLGLPDEYFNKPFKSLVRNPTNLVAVIHF